ncbi:hypothetical protein [Lentzea albidocapillata]
MVLDRDENAALNLGRWP